MRLTRMLLLVSLLALVIVPTALALRFTDDSYNVPNGVIGQAYSKQFNGAGGCGPALPYQYRILSGKLPPGLSLSSSGLISGTPAQAGSWSFWVELSDQNPPSASWCRPSTSQREFTIKITSGVSIVQTSLSPKAAFVNDPYSFQFTAEGGGAKTWSVQSGTLPAGINLGSDGLLSGTPVVTGAFTFTVQVSDGTRSDAQTFSLTIVPQLEVTSPTAPAGEVARPFELALAATGGKPGYTWSLAAGTTLPDGLTLDPAAGVISGQPSAAGLFPTKLTVTDALGLTKVFDVTFAVAAKLAIVKKPLPVARVGRGYAAPLGAVGGVVPRTWKILRGFLPPGIRLDKQTGRLTGTTRRAGTFRLVVQVSDKLGAVSMRKFVLKVRA